MLIFPTDIYLFKDALSGLGLFLVTGSPLKMMQNVFYFTLKSSSRSQDL